MIDVSDNLQFKGAQSIQQTIHKEFQSEGVKDMFEQNIDKNRRSRSGSAGLVIWGMSIGPGASYIRKHRKESEATDKGTKSKMFYSSVHCQLVPVKSVHLTESDIDLKPEAISMLQAIESRIKGRGRGAFQEFFRRYGSHVNYGVIDLGGVFTCSASCQGFKQESLSKVKEKAQMVSKTSLSLDLKHSGIGVRTGIPFKASEVFHKASLNYTEEELKEITVTLTKIGGPEEIDDKDEWRRALLQNSSLWRIVNRTSTPKPIWELLYKYKEKFKSHILLADVMKEEWHNAITYTESKTNRSSDALLQDVRRWVELSKQELDASECMKTLASIRSRHNVTDDVWLNEVIYFPDVQQIITRAVQTMQQGKGPSYVNIILRPVKKLQSRKFPGIKDIISKLQELECSIDINPFKIDNIERIGYFLAGKLKELKYVENAQIGDKLKALQLSLEKTLKTWSDKPSSYAYLACIAVMHQHSYDIFDSRFSYNLLKEDMDGIILALDKHQQILPNLTDETEKQAYVLKLCLTPGTENQFSVVDFMITKINQMPTKLNEDIQRACDSSFRGDGTFDFKKFLIGIERCMNDKFRGVDLEALASYLKSQLSFEKSFENNPSKLGSEHEANVDGEMKKLLDDLGLSRYYPQKLSYDDVITLTPEVLDNKDKDLTNLTDLPWYFMRHIIGLDSNVRENCHITDINQSFTDSVWPESGINNPNNGDKGSSSDDDLDGDEYSLDSGSDYENQEYSEMKNEIDVHPLDLIHAIFLCADDFLRQELADKMLKCQYAVPLILPTTVQKGTVSNHLVLHWGLSSIRRSFHYRGAAENKAMVNLEAPLVACLSIGDETSWKSRLLNKMLSPQQETFWHRGLKGGDCKQKVSQGIVEVGWYLPGGHRDDTFTHPVTFANMRGDAKQNDKIGNKLLASASVICLFAEDFSRSDMKTFLRENKEIYEKTVLVILYRKEREKAIRSKCEQFKKKFKIPIICRSSEDDSFSSVYEQLISAIRRIAQKNKRTFTVSSFAKKVSADGSFAVDDRLCSSGRKAAENILHDIDEINEIKSGSAKSEILPCQSDVKVRKKIAEIDKEICRKKHWQEDSSLEEYIVQMANKKWQLQLEQLQNPISPTFRKFLQCLVTLDSINKKYFLQVLKLGLNERSTQILEPLYEVYRSYQLQADSEEKEEQLQKIGKQIDQSSFGLEHLLREIAVMYENMTALDKHMENKNKELTKRRDILATTVATLFMEGSAIEIMDGDAVSVPMVWLNKVLKCIQQGHNTKLFKVSVLGAQSCGKSTVLNTIFGLNFPVSSGRCTRGAYMQLVKVDQDLRKILNCDYLAVIDSEGLMSRVVDYDRQEFDNELSTFIIGLSDLTLVIIKGEGNEMQDVLPIAIHVFLRMNVVGEHQACHFIHQNMGAVDANSKVATEIEAFVRDLNVKTLAAAKGSGRAEKYSKFSDVLHYDQRTDNSYVPGLWNGTPPMGNANIQYAGKMQLLKQKVVERVRDMKMKSVTSIDDFRKRMDELWRAVKMESFLFSFKNVLAYEAHRNLSHEFTKKQWEMKRAVWKMLEGEITVHENAVAMGNTDQNIRKLLDGSIDKITEFIEETAKSLKESTLHYFRCTNGCKDCDSAIQNRHLLARYEMDFKDDCEFLRKSLNRDINSKMDEVEVEFRTNRELLKMDNAINIHLKKEIQAVVKKYKTSHPGNVDVDDLFKEWWKEQSESLQYLLRRSQPTADPNIEAVVQKAIRCVLRSDTHVYDVRKGEPFVENFGKENSRSETSEVTSNHGQFVARKEHVKFKHFGFAQFTPSAIRRLQEVSDEIIKETRKHYDYTPQTEPKRFAEKDAEILMNDVLERIDALDVEKFEVTTQYKGDLFRHIEILATEGFRKMHREYIENNSPQALFERKKKDYFGIFKMAVGQSNGAELFSNVFVKKMIDINIEKKLTCCELLTDLRENYGDIFLSLKSLQTSIMRDLLEREDFESYHKYITNYRLFLKKCLREKCEKFFRSEDRLKEIKKKLAQRIIQEILEAIDKTMDNPSGNMNFVEIFLSNAGSLRIPRDLASAVKILPVTDPIQFGNYVHQNLRKSVLSQVYKDIDSSDDISLIDKIKLVEFIFKEIVNCTAECPFCSAPCDVHSGGKISGKHSVTYHRPTGLSGYRKRGFLPIGKELFPECCNELVASKRKFKHGTKHKFSSFRNYHKHYPNWLIEPSTSSNTDKYWKWVFFRFYKEFSSRYNAKMTRLPDGWGS